MERKAQWESQSYRLMTLDADKIIEAGYSDAVKVKSKWVPRFQYNLERGFLRDEMIRKKEELYAENALIYQIRRLLDCLDDPVRSVRLLRQSVVFIDFSGPDCQKLMRSQWNNHSEYGCETKEQLEQEKQERLHCLLRPCMKRDEPSYFGLSITFEDGTKKTFVPFDKSASMSRASLISYVDYELKEKLDDCLCLGMDFTKIKAIPSKYFAYRGLYLTDAKRIETNARLQLNEETVLVLPDKSLSSEETLFYIGGGKETRGRTKVAAYDGEGLISPAYADELRNQLFGSVSAGESAYSFQIRLPFGKGMLHQVDFKCFLTEQYGVDWSSPCMIRDAFGVPRDMGKVQIIINESMLKCKKWLARWVDNLNRCSGSAASIDPMRYYFEKMAEYGHSLYVARTDVNLHNTGSVKLGYQALSTLALSPEGFESLVRRQISAIQTVEDQLCTQGIAYNVDVDDEDSSEEDLELNAYSRETERGRCLSALARNRAFLQDDTVKETIRSIRSAYERDLGLGKIMVSGEQRFFSGDLLGLLADLAVGLSAEDPARFSASKAKALYGCCLHPNRFYMPEGVLQIQDRAPYVFLRSPHLSRNEQCLLVPLHAPGGLHQTYFSQLTGVVMVSNVSCVPMALAGADYDGDLVKVIAERVVVDAVEKACYRKEKGYYVRKLSVPNIDEGAPEGNDNPERENPEAALIETAANTFSNQVGLLSNLALRYAALEYGGAAGYENKCVECTIATGLEIDAAKTGKHPNIRELQALIPKRGEATGDFGELKASVKHIADGVLDRPWLSEERKGKRQVLHLYQSKIAREEERADGVLLSSEVYTWEEPVPVLNRLASRLLLYLDEKEKMGEITGAAPKTSDAFFTFQEDPDWKSALDPVLRDETGKMIKAYAEVRSVINGITRQRETVRASSWMGRINILLQNAYDSLHQPLTETEEAVEYALYRTFSTLYDALPDRKAAEDALRSLSLKQWHLTEPDQRVTNLSEILKTEDDRLPAPVCELLGDFRSRGFYLLYYALREAEQTIRRTETTEERLIAVEQRQRERNPSLEKNRYYNAFLAVFSKDDSINLSKQGCIENLNRKCRGELKELFKGQMDVALRYTCAAGQKAQRSRFIWNMFELRELFDWIPEGEENQYA